MKHKILIPYPVKRVYYPDKPVPVYQFLTLIGEAIVDTNGKEKVAETGLNEPYDLRARGRFVVRDGDILDELHITAFEI